MSMAESTGGKSASGPGVSGVASTPQQYGLGELIAALEAKDPALTVPIGFDSPHSYRGDYCELAFEPARNVTVGSMLAAARSALGATYGGWKGGDYTMCEWTPCWLAARGSTGETIGVVLLGLMLEAGDQS